MNAVNNDKTPSAKLFFETINAYQRTAAIRTAIELDLFSAISSTTATAAEIAARIKTVERGARILCDHMTMLGFLEKNSDRYALTRDSAMFLDRASPAYAGGMVQFLLAPHLTDAFKDLTNSVRRGGASGGGTIAPEHPIWLDFARSMAPFAIPGAEALAGMVALDQGRETKVLDISSSHGMWGMTFARRNPKAQITAVDWAPVLELTRETATRLGMSDRLQTIAGSAFEVDLGSGYDLILVPNFLHHFNAADCVRFLTKAHAALRNDGRIAIVEFVPNPDRVSPPEAAGFGLIMVATTPEGDAYTFAEYEEMLKRSGFRSPEAHPLPPVSTVIMARAGSQTTG